MDKIWAFCVFDSQCIMYDDDDVKQGVKKILTVLLVAVYRGCCLCVDVSFSTSETLSQFCLL